eukprot:2828607-Amphidinium_carterae.1
MRDGRQGYSATTKCLRQSWFPRFAKTLLATIRRLSHKLTEIGDYTKEGYERLLAFDMRSCFEGVVGSIRPVVSSTRLLLHDSTIHGKETTVSPNSLSSIG